MDKTMLSLFALSFALTNCYPQNRNTDEMLIRTFLKELKVDEQDDLGSIYHKFVYFENQDLLSAKDKGTIDSVYMIILEKLRSDPIRGLETKIQNTGHGTKA